MNMIKEKETFETYQVKTIDYKELLNWGSLNHIEIDNQFKCFADGGFKNIKELQNLVLLFENSNDPIVNYAFNKWLNEDCSKPGLIELASKLKLTPSTNIKWIKE